MTKIVQKGDPVLARIAEPVAKKDIGDAKLSKILKDMKTAMHGEDDSVAIAAPQIGVPLRIFVVSGPFYEGLPEEEILNTADKKLRDIPDVVFINPEIIKSSKKSHYAEEGCLSVRPWYGDVKRASNVTIKALDKNGNEFIRGSGGLLAQIFQHEIDHLNGILFDSKAKNLRKMSLDEPPHHD